MNMLLCNVLLSLWPCERSSNTYWKLVLNARAFCPTTRVSTPLRTPPHPSTSLNLRALVDFKTQWLMEQAAIKSGAMGPPDRRSQGPSSTQLESTLPQGDVPTEAKGGNTAAAPAHSVNDGQQNQNRATLVIGGAVDASNGGGGGGDGLGATTLAGGGSTVGGTGTVAPSDGGLLPSSGDSLEQIYQSTRTWCRTLRRYPNAMEVLISFARKNPRPQSGILFNQYLSDLTGIMYRRLSTTVEEEVRSRVTLRAILSWQRAPRTRCIGSETVETTRPSVGGLLLLPIFIFFPTGASLMWLNLERAITHPTSKH